MSVPPPLLAKMRGLGFGAGAIGNLYREIDALEAGAAVSAAIEHGVRYFDTAPHYGFGLSERRLGDALREVDPARQAVVSTKVGRVLIPSTAPDLRVSRQGFISPEPYESAFDYSRDGVLRSFEECRRRLGRDIDILFAHDLGRRTHGERHPAQFKLFMDEGYAAMRRLRDEGAVRAIGLGVNEWQICEEVLAQADLDAVLLAGRYTLLEQGALDSFLPLCVQRGVAVIIGGPYNSGVLARGERTAALANYDYCPADEEVTARVEAMAAVCLRHGVPLAAAALQFPLAHPAVLTVIPGMCSAEEVGDAARWMSTSIPAACWQELRELRLLREDAPTPVST